MAPEHKPTNRNSAYSNKRRDSAQKYKKMAQDKALELEVYRTLGSLAAKRTGRTALLARFLDIAIKGFCASAGAVFSVDTLTGKLELEVSKGRKKGMHRVAAEQCALSGKAQHNKESYTETDLSVPIKLKRLLFGVLTLSIANDTPKETTAALKRLNRLARHFSTIVANAEIFSELDSRVNHLSALHELGVLLTSTLDRRVIRTLTIESLIKLMRTETGSLLLVDKKTNELYFDVALGNKGKKIMRTRLQMGEGIAGWVAQHGKPVIIPDVMKDDRFLSSFDTKSKFNTRNMICAPVKIHGEVIGVIQAINRIGVSTFTQNDLKLFQLFANQVAIALDNARLYEEVQDTFYATSEALAVAIEKRDPYTGGHTKRVLRYSLAIADELGLDRETTETLKLSAVLHDIGKIGITDNILGKDAPLNNSEASAMQDHPKLGVEIIKNVPQLKKVIPGIRYHHERVDGFGYPEGTKKIPLIARIISVADTFDAITTTRPYRKGLPIDLALKELRTNRGKQFDRPVVNAFIRAQKKGKIGLNGPKNRLNRLKNTQTTH